MGIATVWRRLSREDLDRVRAAPELAGAILFDGNGDDAGMFVVDPDTHSPEDLMRACGYDREKAAMQLELARLVAEAGGRVEIPLHDDVALATPGADSWAEEQRPGERRTFEWERTWDVLHLLLTGTTDVAPGPAGFVVTGGTPIGPDLGLEPARFLTPDQVRAAERVLDATTPESLAAGLTQAVRAAIGRELHYTGADWDWTQPEVVEEALLMDYRMLRAFFAAAARAGDAMLICLS